MRRGLSSDRTLEHDGAAPRALSLPRFPGHLDWLVKADGDDLDLLLRAVDVSAKASRERVEISGSVPMIDSSDYANLVTIERTSA